MTTTSAPGSQTPTHKAVHNPYAPMWAEAAARVASLIAQVNEISSTLHSAGANLNWQGGSERYFEGQAARQHHYLQVNTNDLGQLRVWMMRAGSAGVTVTLEPRSGGAA